MVALSNCWRMREQIDTAQNQQRIGHSTGRPHDRQCPALFHHLAQPQEQIASHQTDQQPWNDRDQRIGKDQRRQWTAGIKEGPKPGNHAPGTAQKHSRVWPHDYRANHYRNLQRRQRQWTNWDVP